ncbi:penicillin acylase family protein [Sciscionella sediminilitoris]|uniref:penicillin acylase family protein n=1 Tax=Sciscionella sediminilitoris TaxID=1445613 RepID=UPI0004DF4DE8|nr:penicillin acylase family protein [Sciscionella sp. SE31]
MRNRTLLLALLTALVIGIGATPATASEQGLPPGSRAVLRYTEYGIPHILARDFSGLGYGSGFAAAKDNICTLADVYLSVRGERSRFLGAEAKPDSGLTGARSNVDSDAFFRSLDATGAVRRMLAAPPPYGPRAEVRELVRGYVQGYNKYLAAGKIGDPRCAGKPWVRPITEFDVYRHVYATTAGGTDSFADAMVNARPDPETSRGNVLASVRNSNANRDRGSNAIAIGRAGSAPGRSSVLLGNPHYPWHGSQRFWQNQLTIPGKFDVSGASLLGFPLVQIGHNADFAWSHTVSTSANYSLFENPTVPGDPHSYLVNGKPERMRATRVTVPVRDAKPVSKTVYRTRYGPVVTAMPDGTALPWGKTAYSVHDVNAANMRALNTWFGLDTARNTKGAAQVLRATQGSPWVNTIASDSQGNALYSDVQASPNVTDSDVARCGTALGKQLYAATGTAVLDGARSDCGPATDPEAVQPGLLGPAKQPQLSRPDFVTNSNDSAWLTNPAQPLTDYPRTMGDIGTQRSLRTQEGTLTAQRRIAGTDGLPGKGFTEANMRELLFRDTSRAAVLAGRDTARLCAELEPGSPACSALSTWDGRFSLQSKGSLLFQRFFLKVAKLGSPWLVPFDPGHPLSTPNTLNIGDPGVRKAFRDAVGELRAAGLALDTSLAAGQYVVRNGERIPIHGGPQALGVLDVITPQWDPKRGNTEVVHGSSSIQSVEFTARGPRASTLLTYSQSADPSSPHYSDQTRLFSAGKWVRDRFTAAEIASAPGLRNTVLR